MVMKNGEFECELKSGIGFYIGDVCYVLGDETYYGVWQDKYEFSDGKIETDEGTFAVASTAYGDGEYRDNAGYSYPVDAGVIGCVPLELVKKEEISDLESEGFGRVVIADSAKFITDGEGHFEIIVGDKYIEICTKDEDDDDSYYDCEEDEEDYEDDDYDDYDDEEDYE